MNILIACEESQRICIEMRSLGHRAFSCDIQDCSGGHPEWHIKQDVIPLLNGNCNFLTCDGVEHTISGRWDLIIAHPPCTYLTNSGNRWFNEERYGDKARQRKLDREDAVKFFMEFANADCDHICIENPIGTMSTRYRKPDQIIHPYYFAEEQDDENCTTKATCFWLKGLKPLEYEIKFEPILITCKNGKKDSVWHMETLNLPKAERAKVRSKTYPGIAKAIAKQFTEQINSEK